MDKEEQSVLVFIIMIPILIAVVYPLAFLASLYYRFGSHIFK